MNKEIMIGNHKISEDSPTFVIAEMSANHLMDFDRAVAIMQAAKDAGADAIKIQTYTPDTITLDCDDPCFQITQGTIWDGTTLHKLYETAYTPWEWQPKLKKIAEEMGLVFFSSPFDLTSIDFLEEMEVPVYKVASFEINDIPFIRKIARTGKPIIMSTGIAYLADIELALRTCKEEGNENVILLKCTSAYPAPYEDINLKTIPSMKEVFDCVVGLSDHTMGCAVAGAGVALGAKQETFAGLSGVGDLIVTCCSMHSRNHRCGIYIGQGLKAKEAMEKVGAVVEGYYATASAHQLAEKYGIEMPIADAAYQVLYGDGNVQEAIGGLMRRQKRHEIDEIWLEG